MSAHTCTGPGCEDCQLAEDASQVVAAMPPPTEEQLRRLAAIWPPRPEAEQ